MTRTTVVPWVLTRVRRATKQEEDVIFQKIIKTQEELVKILKEQSASLQKALEEALEADDCIMVMDEEAKAYWQKKRCMIFDRPE
jgi:molybdopterin converting factor small subunit